MPQRDYVYFIQQGDSGPIKIGFSTNPVDRFINLQRNNPDRLYMLGVIPGDQKLETELHQRFQGGEIWAEWFEPTPSLIEFIKTKTTPFSVNKRLRKVSRGKPKSNGRQPVDRPRADGVTSKLDEFWSDYESKNGRSISVLEVASKTGLAWETINNLREDKTRRFDGDVIAKLCQYFDVPGGEVVPFLCVDYHDAMEMPE